MNKQFCRMALAMALVGCSLPSAHAVVIVADDFFYQEKTKPLFDFAGFTYSSFGGGQNGPGGVWDDRWTAIGGVTIVGTDVVPPSPFVDNPHTAVVTEVATAASLQRPWLPVGAAAGASTIYFAADFKVDDPAIPSLLAEFGILSPTNNLGVPSVSMGITDSVGTVPATFFAKIGDTIVTGDAGLDPDDALPAGAYVRMVGKLEINAVAGGGDFDGNGQTDGNDFLLWQRQVGTNQPPGTGANGNDDNIVDGADLEIWKNGYNSGDERLTVYFAPTGVEMSNATVLTATAPLIDSISNSTLARMVSLNGFSSPADSDRAHYVDNLVLGTTWADVTSVAVPRLTLEVNTTSGAVRLINNSAQDIDLAYYEILSEGDSLNAASWSSLDDQNVTGGTWAENNPNAGQLIESNFTSATTIAAGGGVLALGNAFTPSGNQDLIARWGVKQGFDGLLNVANISYVTAAAASAVPEPAAWTLALVAAAAGLRRRTR